MHLFPSHSFSPGDLAAKGKGENKGEKRAEACFIAFSRWINDELMGKNSRRSNEKVNKQNKKLDYELAERQTDKETGG